jgi:heme exporter protein D
MSWGSAAEFLAMGGRGLFVWGAYAVAAVLLAAELALLRRRRRTLLGRLGRSVRQKLANP